MKSLLIIVYVFFSLPGNCQQANEQSTYPDSSWEKLDQFHLVEWDSLKLADLRKFVIDSAHTTGLIIIYHGKVLLEFGDVIELSYLASARKSILSMIYGPFVKNGTINLSKTLSQLEFEDKGGLLPVEKQATVRDLLTARSGIYHAASNSGDETAMAPQRGTKQPGTFFLYNNWD